MARSADAQLDHLADDLSKSRLGDLKANYDTISDDLESEEEEPEALAEHACAYCGIDDVNCVLQCLICKRWYVFKTHNRFCNGRGRTTSSHIVTHLVRARHKAVMLHPNSPLGDTVPECYTCGSKNPFMLGFLPAQGSTVVMILCRNPCNYAANTKEVAWDASQWSPLIENRSFLSWFARIPSSETQRRAKPITSAQISKLEDLWRDNERATLEDVENPTKEQELPKMLVRYDTAEQYFNILRSLISVEEQYDKKLKESLIQHDVAVRWEPGKGRSMVLWLRLPQLESGEIRLGIGDELCVSYAGTLASPWKATLRVLQFSPTSSMEVACEVPPFPTPPVDCTTNFTVEFVWVGVTYTRMKKALSKFLNTPECMTPYLRKKLLGFSTGTDQVQFQEPKRYAAPGLPDLNHSQVAAIKSVLSKSLSLIQGPPGTGKTVTSATIVYHLANMSAGKILVCAPSNVAVDQLTEKIHRTGLKVVRLVSRMRETIASPVRSLALHEQVVLLPPSPEMSRLLQLKSKNGELGPEENRRYRNLIFQMERKILAAADVICTTCSSSGDRRLDSFEFSTVLIDEATQAIEPEILLPIVRGCKKLVLVGDHQQLGPVVMSNRVALAGMNLSLFERLILLGNQPRRLEVQYRMHPCLSEFPSNMFYDGMLQNGVTAQERLRRQDPIPWPINSMPMMFYQNLGQEEVSGSGTSYLNRTEASSVEKIITLILKAGVLPEQIGVVTPYEGQRNFIINYMQMFGSLNKDLYRNVEVASVDAFQGREKDYIIVSCVRSNDRAGIGFLSDPRRLNVALTRARYGLIVIGNAKVLCKNPLWYHLLVHFKDRFALVEGALSNLQPCMIQFGRPPVERSRATPMQRMASQQPKNTVDSLAMDPIHAPFRTLGAPNALLREDMWSSLSLDAKSLSYTQSDRLTKKMAGDDDLDSLDGFKSQASLEDDLEDVTNESLLPTWGPASVTTFT